MSRARIVRRKREGGVDWIRFFGWIVILIATAMIWIGFIGLVFAILSGSGLEGFEFWWFL